MSPGWGSSDRNVSQHVLHCMVHVEKRKRAGRLIRPVTRIYRAMGIEAITPHATTVYPEFLPVVLHPFLSDHIDSTYLPLATSHGNVDETASVL